MALHVLKENQNHTQILEDFVNFITQIRQLAAAEQVSRTPKGTSIENLLLYRIQYTTMYLQ